MKNKLLRPVCALLALFLLLVPMTLSVSADEGEAPEWKLAPDFSKVTYGDDVYYLYEFPEKTGWAPSKSLYIYSVTYEYDGINPTLYGVSAPEKNHGFVFAETSAGDAIFAREDALQELKNFENGINVQYRFLKKNQLDVQAPFDSTVVSRLKNLPVSSQIGVATLSSLESHTLVCFDETLSLYRTVGMFFFFSDGIGFVDFSKLDNSNFDSEGNISFRSGTMPVSAVKEGTASYNTIMTARENAKPVEVDVLDEDALQMQAIMKLIALPLFWVLFAITGAILPGVGITIGAIRAHAATPKTRKRWYVLIGMCALWLLLALIIFLMMII